MLLFSYAQSSSAPLIATIQEAFEKCWADSPLRAAARRLFYIAIHQVSLLSHTASRTPPAHRCPQRQRVTGDRYGPIEWAQIYLSLYVLCRLMRFSYRERLRRLAAGTTKLISNRRLFWQCWLGERLLDCKTCLKLVSGDSVLDIE